ncbi:MAG: class I SAM-dependent methyltransferase [Thermodesulfobacteriota bacterium]
MKNIKQTLKQSEMIVNIYKNINNMFYTLCKVMRREPGRPTEKRDYWESRGERYIEEVKSIYTNPEDPYYLAQSEIIRMLAEVPWKSLLEVGCGFGFYLEAFRQAFPERLVVGVDFSYSNLINGLKYLKNRHCNALMAQADAFNLPFMDGSFDLVFTSGLICCVHPKKIPLFIKEIKRVSNGHFLFVEYIEEHSRVRNNWEIPYHFHNLSKICSSHGLIIKESKPFDAFTKDQQGVPLSLTWAFDPSVSEV